MGIKKKVAIIEDDLFLRQLYEKKFTQAGYEVMLAEDGKSGLEMITKNKPDALLLDIAMPVMNGLEVLATIRSSANLADLKVVFLTNNEKTAERQAADELKADGYLVKADVLPSEVLFKIQQLIG